MYTYGLPLIGWNVSLDVIQLTIFLWTLLFYVGHFAKDYFKLPRPQLVNHNIVTLENVSQEYGMPSTHVQAAIALPTFIIYEYFSKYGSFSSFSFIFYSFIAFIYISLVAISRIYLSVHSFFDLIFGAIFI